MRHGAHFPWRQLIGVVVLLLVIASLAAPVWAAKATTPPSADPNSQEPGSMKKEGGGDTTPGIWPDGDPDDYGEIPPILLVDLILLLSLWR